MRAGSCPDGVVRVACIIDGGGGGGTDKYFYSYDFFSDVCVVLLVLMLIRLNILVVFQWYCHILCMDDCGVVNLYMIIQWCLLSTVLVLIMHW